MNLYLQGEPFLHPEFTEMVKIASEKKLYTITSTNGQIFNRKIAEDIVDNGLSEIYFSLDGVTQETYSRYRKGGSLEKVKSAVRTLAAVRREKKSHFPKIIVQFIVFRHNEHEADEFVKLAKELGADKAEIKTAQFNEFSKGEVEPPVDPRYRRYADAEARKLKGRPYNHCWKSWMSMAFTWNGEALPCCYDKDGIHSMGEFKGNFNELWFGNKNISFKAAILQKRSEIDICKNCPEGRNFIF
jgi:MoaA/NifB/PqqE/SkfB family radical SAM enzyme